MTELADAAYDAHAVIGSRLPSLEQELGDTAGFAERIRVVETRLIGLLSGNDRRDPVAVAANRLFASHGMQRVSTMAMDSGLSIRQFERRFLAQVGVPPKFYARVIRFNAVLDQKLRRPGLAWSRIATDHDYHDQMHFVHECRALTGETPSRLLAQLDSVPAFHSFFATADRPRHE
jgi:AraC-like DNA-binding protein